MSIKLYFDDSLDRGYLEGVMSKCMKSSRRLKKAPEIS